MYSMDTSGREFAMAFAVAIIAVKVAGVMIWECSAQTRFDLGWLVVIVTALMSIYLISAYEPLTEAEEIDCDTESDGPSQTANSRPSEADVILSNGRSIAEMTTIKDTSLIRGTRPDFVLRHLGELLQSPDHNSGCHPDEDLYDLSETIPHIDEFISHTWRCNRILKLFALSMHYRSTLSVVGGTLAATIMCMVQFTGLSGEVLTHTMAGMFDDAYEFHRGGLCFWVGNFVMLLLLFTSTGAWFLPSESSTRWIFVDKICINLKNPIQRLQQIHSLGGILQRCRRLVVIWNDTYFERLWCVFELACFTRSHGTSPDRLKFIPIMSGFTTMSLTISCFAIIGVTRLFGIYNFMDPQGPTQIFAMAFVMAFQLVGNVGIYYVIDCHVTAVKSLRDQLNNFSVRKCKVFDENDRSVVEGCISTWFGSLDDFDRFVHDELKPTLLKRLNPIPPESYSSLVLTSWHHIFFIFDIAPYGDMLGSGYCDTTGIIVNMLVMTPVKLCALVKFAQYLQLQSLFISNDKIRFLVGGFIFMIVDVAFRNSFQVYVASQSPLFQACVTSPFALLLVYLYCVPNTPDHASNYQITAKANEGEEVHMSPTQKRFDHLPSHVSKPMAPQVCDAEKTAKSHLQSSVSHISNLSKIKALKETTEIPNISSIRPSLSVPPASKHRRLSMQISDMKEERPIGVSIELLVHFRKEVMRSQFFEPVSSRARGEPYKIQQPPNSLDVYAVTVTDVVEQFIKGNSTGSYANSLVDAPKNATGPANIFVSHVWSYNFFDTIDQLIALGEKQPGCYFWFDILVVDQNDCGALPYTFWSTTFKESIRKIGHTLVVLSPWHAPKPLQRAWCLWEMYCTFDCNVTFDILLPKQEAELLKLQIAKDFDAITDAMMNVDAENADANKIEDKNLIFAAIRGLKGGFHEFNLKIKRMLRDWVFQTIIKEFSVHEQAWHAAKLWSSRTLNLKRPEIEDDSPSAPNLTKANSMTDVFAKFAFNLGRIMTDAGDAESALMYFKKAHAAYSEIGNSYSISCCDTSIGKTYTTLDQIENAKLRLSAALKIQEEFVGLLHFEKLSVLDDLSESELKSGAANISKSLVAEGVPSSIGAIYLAAPASEKWGFGVWITSTASTYRGFGALHFTCGEYAYARRYYLKALKIYEAVMDDTSESPYFKSVSRTYLLAKTLCALGDIEFVLQNYESAVSYHTRARDLCKSVLGQNHPMTARSYINFGTAVSALGDPESGMRYINQAIAILEQNEGQNHLSTAVGYSGIGKVFLDKNDVDSATTYFSKAYEIRKASLGINHPLTARSLAELSTAHTTAAAITAMEAAKVFEASYGANHPQTMHAIEAATSIKPYKVWCYDVMAKESHGDIAGTCDEPTDNIQDVQILLQKLVDSETRDIIRVREIAATSMASFADSQMGLDHGRCSILGNPCFHGECTVQAYGDDHIQIKNLARGARILTTNGQYCEVLCVVKSPCEGDRSKFLHFDDGLRITPFHPIRIHGKWAFPQQYGTLHEEECRWVFNLVLAEKHIAVVNGIECATLGHGFDDHIVAHPYLGTSKVIDDLMLCPGWKDGYVYANKISRDPVSKMINWIGSDDANCLLKSRCGDSQTYQMQFADIRGVGKFTARSIHSI